VKHLIRPPVSTDKSVGRLVGSEATCALLLTDSFWLRRRF
jgi:hypothetical protein